MCISFLFLSIDLPASLRLIVDNPENSNIYICPADCQAYSGGIDWGPVAKAKTLQKTKSFNTYQLSYVFKFNLLAWYRVIFFTGTPPEISKYRKVNIG